MSFLAWNADTKHLWSSFWMYVVIAVSPIVVVLIGLLVYWEMHR